MPSKAAARPSKPTEHPVRDAADALYRTAKESCHQHERLGKLIAAGADEKEYAVGCDMADIIDKHLAARTADYETVAGPGKGVEADAFWHAANALWAASREYGRRNEASNAVASKSKRHSAAQLGEITMEYELELSARMALKTAVTAYAATRES
jgi:hypothetical protein